MPALEVDAIPTSPAVHAPSVAIITWLPGNAAYGNVEPDAVLMLAESATPSKTVSLVVNCVAIPPVILISVDAAGADDVLLGRFTSNPLAGGCIGAAPPAYDTAQALSFRMNCGDGEAENRKPYSVVLDDVQRLL